ncbi:MAG TPA: choice-of-anchor I family protein [Chitinispirillaceae bacterium]|nr:choice-of-anchor I family protein [Chitinispirillaceae bacterium]
MQISKLGTIATGSFGTGAAEISAYDPVSERIFVSNAESNTIDIISIHDPANPQKIITVDCSRFGGGINSVAFKNGLVAAAIEAEVKQMPGSVVFFDISGNFLKQFTAGALPDMVTFTRDGKKVLLANEGEPDATYTNDPEGSVTIVDISKGLENAIVNHVYFRQFNCRKEWLIKRNVRIFGPKATVAQDLEPEFITVGPYGNFAYVTLQENNAIAEIDINHAYCLRIIPMGLKDHSLPGNGIDASDKDGCVSIRNWPVYGMYQPDAIASYTYMGLRFLVTANEGDSRDYEGYSEEARIKDLELDPNVFPNFEELIQKANLGRLKTTTALAQINTSGQYIELFSFGGRSFSIIHPSGNLIYDSRDDFEKITAGKYPDFFNSDNESNLSFDSRSDDKGPEPEALVLGHMRGRTYAFIGLERIGGIMVYDITNPFEVDFITYFNPRNFNADEHSSDTGDLGVEGLVFVEAKDSPVKKPLLIASNEISGTVTIFQISMQ